MNENFAKIWLFGITIMFFFTCFLGQGWLLFTVAVDVEHVKAKTLNLRGARLLLNPITHFIKIPIHFIALFLYIVYQNFFIKSS